MAPNDFTIEADWYPTYPEISQPNVIHIRTNKHNVDKNSVLPRHDNFRPVPIEANYCPHEAVLVINLLCTG